MKNDTFNALGLTKPILRALKTEGYSEPTPIQVAAIPQVLRGRDLMATAQTGTGKTAAFSLPMLQLLAARQTPEPTHYKHKKKHKRNRSCARALILTPTRELARQIDTNLRAYGRHLPFRTAVILGGVPIGGQLKALSRNPEILVATPGRLLDLTQRGDIRLDNIEMLVLDEADRMLDMGFIHDMRKIVKQTPRSRQTLLFSATLSDEIKSLAADMLRVPASVEVAPPATVAGKISQKVLFVDHRNRLALLSTIIRNEAMGRTLVFTRTKRKADRISRSLAKRGLLADSIHSDKTQGARERVLAGFGRGKIKVLVATDIVARGIDVDGISHVINYEMPHDAESYVHRIGRTARAGADGTAYSFCDAEDMKMLRTIEALTKTSLDTHKDHPYHVEANDLAPSRPPARRRGGNGHRKRSNNRGRRVYR